MDDDDDGTASAPMQFRCWSCAIIHRQRAYHSWLVLHVIADFMTAVLVDACDRLHRTK